MSGEVDIVGRTFDFSVRIVKLCQVLDKLPGVPRILAGQILRSGSSIGANVEEAQAGQSKADFISKLSIACKEARETRYWLRLLTATDIMSKSILTPLIDEANQLTAILITIINNTRGAGSEHR